MILRTTTVLAAVTTGAFAVLATAGIGIAAAAPAHHPAAHHTAAHHTAAHHTAAHHVQTRGATHDIKVSIARLDRIQKRVAANHALSDADRAALQSALSADRAALADDLTALGSATTRSQVRAIVGAAHTTTDLAVKQTIVVALADKLAARQAKDAATLTSLTGQVDAAQTGGADVTSEQAQLADMQARLTTATDRSAAAAATMLGTAPDATRSAVRSAFKSAQTNLRAARAALDAAEADAEAVQAALAALTTP